MSIFTVVLKIILFSLIIIITQLFFCRTHSLNRLNKTIYYLRSLPEQHQRLLINYSNSLETIRNCIDYNYNVILEMVKDTAYLFENQDTPSLDGWVMIKIYLSVLFEFFLNI